MDTSITMLGNNKVLVSYRNIVIGTYNTGEVWKKATYEYKKEGSKIFVRCFEMEEFKDLDWDEIPEDTRTEKYDYKAIVAGSVNKDVIKEYHLEYKEKEYESACKRHELNDQAFYEFRVEEEKINRLKRLILKRL